MPPKDNTQAREAVKAMLERLEQGIGVVPAPADEIRLEEVLAAIEEGKKK